MGLTDKLYETAGSIKDWATYPSSSISDSGTPSSSSSGASGDDGYWAYASKSFQNAVNSTSAAASSLYESLYSSTTSAGALPEQHDTDNNVDVNLMAPPPSSSKSTTSMPARTNKFIGWKLQNPYSNIRGHQVQPSSLSAVRSLLRVVPVTSNKQDYHASLQHVDTSSSSLDVSVSSLEHHHHPPEVSRNETASQLAEGTIRALRDLELDEAMELHIALRYWTHRWERPLLSWIEAGPWGTCVVVMLS